MGAYVLADEIGKTGHAGAGAERMRPYVARTMAFGRRMVKDMVPGGRLAIAFRDYGMRTLNSTRARST